MNPQNSTKKLDKSQEAKSHWQKYKIKSQEEKPSALNSPITRENFFVMLGKLAVGGIVTGASYDGAKRITGVGKPEDLSEQEIMSYIRGMPDFTSKQVNPKRTHYLTYPEEAHLFLRCATLVFSCPDAWSSSKVSACLLITSALANSNRDAVRRTSDYNKVSNKAHDVLNKAEFDKYVHKHKVKDLHTYLPQRTYLFSMAEAEGKPEEVNRCRNFIYWNHPDRGLQSHSNFEVELVQGYFEDPAGELCFFAIERKLNSDLQRDLKYYENYGRFRRESARTLQKKEPRLFHDSLAHQVSQERNLPRPQA